MEIVHKREQWYDPRNRVSFRETILERIETFAARVSYCTL